MTKVLLSIHVLAAILAVGPVAVAASMFPAAAHRARTTSENRDRAVLLTLHRVCRVYAAVGVAVPVFGLATANSLGVLGDAWLITSIGLTAAAAGVLVFLVLPRQNRLLAGVDDDRRGPRAAGHAHRDVQRVVGCRHRADDRPPRLDDRGVTVNALRAAAVVELVSLAVLLANLATAHWPAVSSLVGPTHGCAYVFVVVLTARASRANRVRVTAAVPGIGGVLALRQLTRARH